MKRNIAVAVYTYDRVDDARINFEIIRNIWEGSEYFKNVTIIHSYNGDLKWYPDQYLENKLIRIKNRGHYPGAADLIESGVNYVLNNKTEIDYVVTLAADTWILDPIFVHNIIEKMAVEGRYVAASCWGNPFENNPMKMGLSTDLFVIDTRWAKDCVLFPLNYDDFYKKYFEVLIFEKKIVFLERVFSLRFFQASQKHFGYMVSDYELAKKKDELLHRITEREPVHNYYPDLIYRKDAPLKVKIKKAFNIDSPGYRNMYWPKIGLLTHHDPIQKQKDLINHSYPNMKYTNKFVKSNNLDYYNKNNS